MIGLTDQSVEHRITMLIDEGNKLIDSGKYTEAIGCYNKAIAIDPNNPNANYGKGLCFAKLELYVVAIKYYDRAIAINPSYTEAWKDKVEALGALARYNEVVECCEKVLAIDPNNFYALHYKEAAKGFDKATKKAAPTFDDGTTPVSDRPGHLWTGLHNPAPPETVQASDWIQLVSDSGIRSIPDKSWIVDFFEIYNSIDGRGVINLGLVSEYTGKTRFVAILQGYNKYYFSIPVVKGHTYRRTISIDKKAGLIYYLLEDTSSKAQESFEIDIPIDFIPIIVSVFRGVEWHNRVADMAFPIAWVVSMSHVVSFNSSLDTSQIC